MKFVWGRSKFPNNEAAVGDDKHHIDKYDGNANNLPLAHTCFFSMDLPVYPSYVVFKQKIEYAINNAFIITDGNTGFIDTEEMTNL